MNDEALEELHAAEVRIEALAQAITTQRLAREEHYSEAERHVRACRVAKAAIEVLERELSEERAALIRLLTAHRDTDRVLPQ